jgi:branched-subunit amino acid permease
MKELKAGACEVAMKKSLELKRTSVQKNHQHSQVRTRHGFVVQQILFLVVGGFIGFPPHAEVPFHTDFATQVYVLH